MRRAAVAILAFAASVPAKAQAGNIQPAQALPGHSLPGLVSYDAAARVFRLDGGNVSYVFGVNARGELEQILLGRQAGRDRRIPPAEADARVGVL